MNTTKKPRTSTIHSKEMVMNKDRLKTVLDSKDLEYKEFHELVTDKWGLDLTYKGFMSLLGNRVTWKLLYAHAIADVLKINYMDVFDIVDVDVEKAKQEKEEWKRKYGKNRKKG